MSSPASAIIYWDIFCRVVDNFGDIGVSWRLARQLADERGITIHLWVDDIALAQKFAGDGHANVHLRHWTAQIDFPAAAPVVIETFSCGLPQRYQQAMTPHSIWLNVDYLSAETWVESFHGKPSPQSNGLVRYFFYPGFSEHTGGLLRENFLPGLKQQSAQTTAAGWKQLGLHALPDVINLSLFCYAHAPIKSLLDSLASSHQSSRLIVPENVAPYISQALNVSRASEHTALTPGQTIQHQNCQIVVIPFLSQENYDRLLAMCDVNFVRGEDSWIRAIWAARPMVWLPYQQSENTHLHKLDAFLQRYLSLADDVVKTPVRSVMRAWASGLWSDEDWQHFMRNRDSITQHAATIANQLAQQPDLATNLVIFIEKLQANRV